MCETFGKKSEQTMLDRQEDPYLYSPYLSNRKNCGGEDAREEVNRLEETDGEVNPGGGTRTRLEIESPSSSSHHKSRKARKVSESTARAGRKKGKEVTCRGRNDGHFFTLTAPLWLKRARTSVIKKVPGLQPNRVGLDGEGSRRRENEGGPGLSNITCSRGRIVLTRRTGTSGKHRCKRFLFLRGR